MEQNNINIKVLHKMTSNSSIISLILDNEKDKLNQELDTIIENKIASIKDLLGETIKRNINSSIQEFYKPDTNILREDEVFNFKLNLKLVFQTKRDTFGNKIPFIKCYKKSDDYESYKKIYKKGVEFINENVLKLSSYYQDSSAIIYVGNSFVVIENEWYYNGSISNDIRHDDIKYEYYEHNIPLNIINIIKNCYKNQGRTNDTKWIKQNIINLCQMSLDNPLLFSSCGQNFENLCNQEYDEINGMKQDLEKKEKEWENLINEEYDKRDYYNYLESNQKNIEQQKVDIDEEKNKLKLTYDKLKQMRTEIENERKLFEQEKEEYYKRQNEQQIDKFDIDSYLTSGNLNETDNEFRNENITMELQK